MVNFEATDGAHHYFWQHHDPSHPRHDPVLADRWGDAIGRVYAATDRELGRLIEVYEPDTVFVVSDHGGGPTDDWVLFINDWLAAEGFLHLVRGGSSTIARRLYGQVKERVPEPLRRGLRPWLGKTVDRAKGNALYGGRGLVAIERVRADAGRDPAEPGRPGALRHRRRGGPGPGAGGAFGEGRGAGRSHAASGCFRRPWWPPTFTGGTRPAGWDLVLERRPQIHVRSRNTTSRPGSLVRLSDLGMYLPSGLHTPVGMVAAAGAGIAKSGQVLETDIHDVAPSVLAVMGVGAPDLDGHPMSFVTKELGSSGASLEEAAGGGTEFTPEEEQAVLERLQALGYVD